MHKNFDAFENEVTQEKHTFTFRGEEYSFSSNMPYFTQLRMTRLMKSGNDVVLAGVELYDLLRTILGDDQLAKLESASPSEDEGSDILRYIFDVYGETARDKVRNGESDRKNVKTARRKA